MASPSALSDDFAVLNDALAAGSLFPASEVAGAGRSVVLACSAAALKATTSRSFGSGKRYQVDLLPELGCLTPVFIGTSLAKNVVFKVWPPAGAGARVAAMPERATRGWLGRLCFC